MTGAPDIAPEAEIVAALDKRGFIDPEAAPRFGKIVAMPPNPGLCYSSALAW